MRDILSVARAQLVISLRERITLFWFLLFPLFLLVLLSLIFANAGRTDDLSFDVTVVNLDRGATAGEFGASMLDALRKLAVSGPESGKPLFRLREPPDSANMDEYVALEIQALRVGKRDAVVVIPKGFSEALLAAIGTTPAAPTAQGTSGIPAAIEVHTSGGRTSSDMALGVIGQVLASADKEVLTQLGLFDGSRAVVVNRASVGAEDKTLAYVDFLVPGVVIMGFFVAGLFSVPGTILFGREGKILRRYWVTPLDVRRFLAGFTLGHIALCALQFVCVWGLGRFAFGAQVDFSRPLALLYLALSVVAFLAVGFLVAALARTANSGMAIANIVNMPMMFLGGLFFPTGSVPPALRVVMMANPVTYLADGLRASVGAGTAVYGHGVSIGVPCAWIVLCVFVASLRIKWDVGR